MARRCLICVSIVLLTACASSNQPAGSDTAPGPIIEVTGDTVVYRGAMTAEGLAELKSKAQGQEITTLLVSSPGGEVSVGMDFGTWVYENKLDVVIGRACLSSCANYVFPAGRKKTIPPGSVVAWHGSARQRSFMELMEDEKKMRKLSRKALRARQGTFTEEELDEQVKRFSTNLREQVRKQDEFYAMIGVDEAVTRIGQEEYGARGLFSMSVEDMERFGIRNVTASPDYTKTDLRELNKAIDGRIEFIKIKDSDL